MKLIIFVNFIFTINYVFSRTQCYDFSRQLDPNRPYLLDIPAVNWPDIIKYSTYKDGEHLTYRHQVIPYERMAHFWNMMFTRYYRYLNLLGGYLVRLTYMAEHFYDKTVVEHLKGARILVYQMMDEKNTNPGQFTEQEKSYITILQSLFVWTPSNTILGEDSCNECELKLPIDKYSKLLNINQLMQELDATEDSDDISIMLKLIEIFYLLNYERLELFVTNNGYTVTLEHTTSGDIRVTTVKDAHNTNNHKYKRSVSKFINITNLSKEALTDIDPFCLSHVHKALGKIDVQYGSGTWDKFYPVQVSYSIAGTTYIYQHANTKEWCVHEILLPSQFSYIIDEGTEVNYYKCILPFTVGSRTFNYMSCSDNTDDTSYQIVAFNQNGTISQGSTGSGIWDYYRHIQFTYSINGKSFIYAYCKDTRKWSIYEPTSQGELGSRTSTDIEDNEYKIQIPFNIEEKAYFYGQMANEKNNTWIIRELLPNGTVGKITDSGEWNDKFYEVRAAYNINGKQFMYGQSVQGDKNYWYIQRIHKNGKMGAVTDYNVWDKDYQTINTFVMNDRHYLYGQNKEDKSYFIRELF